jgi:hypothetical protein
MSIEGATSSQINIFKPQRIRTTRKQKNYNNMKPTLLIQIAAGLIIFFAAGHTIGHFTRHDTKDPKAQEVLRIMAASKFDMFGVQRSFDENYTGMSFNLIITLLLLGTTLFQLAKCSVTHPQITRSFLIPISVAILGFSVTGFMYFFLAPAISCLLAFGFLLFAIVRLDNNKS